VLRDGRLQQLADPLTLYHRPVNRFVAGFIGSPAMNFVSASVVDGGSRLTVGDVSLTVPEASRARIARWSGRSLVLGVRPEDVEGEPADKAPDRSLPGRVAVREPLGAEVLLHCDTAAGPLVVRVTRGDPPEVDAAVRLAPDLSRAHYFDSDTEATIGV